MRNNEKFDVLFVLKCETAPETYYGESGYIYSAKQIESYSEQEDIPYAIITECEVLVDDCEYVPDAYEAMKIAEENGEIIITEYSNNSPEMMEWIKKAIITEYDNANMNPEYKEFLKAKFYFL